MKAQLAPALSARPRPIYRRDMIKVRSDSGSDFMKNMRKEMDAMVTGPGELYAPPPAAPAAAAPVAAVAVAVNPAVPVVALSPDCKRMYVHWCYIMTLATSMVNAATLIQFDEVVMHMTGPSTKGPLFLASGLAARGWHNLGTVGAFLGGCFFAGLATSQNDANTPVKETGLFKPFVAPTCSLY